MPADPADGAREDAEPKREPDSPLPQDDVRPDHGRRTPAEPTSPLLHDRAIAVERLIREAISGIGGNCAEALLVLFCLTPGTLELNLEQRRQHTGRLLSVEAETFRRDRYEGLLIWDLSMEIYARIA